MIEFYFLRVVDKMLLYIPIYRWLICALLFRLNLFSKNREQQDLFIQQKLEDCSSKKVRLPKVSAIYRVKNGAAFIESSIYSVLPLVSEIIVVDNKSTDNTLDILNRLKIELSKIVEFKIYTYDHSIALAGSSYQNQLSTGNKSLADFYNYSFSKGTSPYLIKVDAHYIFTIHKIEQIQKIIEKRPDVIYYRGCEIFGRLLSVEPHCFKKDIGYKFIDSDNYEILKFDNSPKLNKKFIITPVFIHIKRLTYSKFVESTKKAVQGLYQ